MWGEQVTVVSTDMRFWDAPEKADILVSELLGSFGDNELSPECLDGAQKFLKGNVVHLLKNEYCGTSVASVVWKTITFVERFNQDFSVGISNFHYILYCFVDDGISIPRAYTSYIAPLTSQKLWNEARLCKDQSKPPEVCIILRSEMH